MKLPIFDWKCNDTADFLIYTKCSSPLTSDSTLIGILNNYYFHLFVYLS